MPLPWELKDYPRNEVLDFEGLFHAFEEVLKVRDKFYVFDNHPATALCEL
jgi:hypothetical protein